MSQERQYRIKEQPTGLTLGWEDIALIAIGPDTSTAATFDSLRVYMHGSQSSRNQDETIVEVNDKSTENHRVTGLAGPFRLVPIAYEGNHRYNSQ